MPGMDIEWDKPPADVLFRARNQGGKYVELALVLREHPDQWAKMPADDSRTEKTAQNLALNIRRGKVKGFGPSGAFESAYEGTTIWVRYLTPKAGNGSDDDPPADPDDAVDPAAVREWARKNGWPKLSERGRLSGEIIEGYMAAHPTPGLRSVT